MMIPRLTPQPMPRFGKLNDTQQVELQQARNAVIETVSGVIAKQFQNTNPESVLNRLDAVAKLWKSENTGGILDRLELSKASNITADELLKATERAFISKLKSMPMLDVEEGRRLYGLSIQLSGDPKVHGRISWAKTTLEDRLYEARILDLMQHISRLEHYEVSDGVWNAMKELLAKSQETAAVPESGKRV